MLQGGYANARRPNPMGLGAVFALHAGVLGAIILAPPETFTSEVFTRLQTYNIPDLPPPPPSQPETKSNPQSNIARVVRQVEVPQQETVAIIPIDPPPFDPPPLPPGPQVTRDQRPAPVLVDARVDPRYASALQPPYPSAMARQEIEGRVVIRVLIGVDGRVKAVEPVSASDPAFHEATATQAMKRWRFKPATRDGVPVESWRTMTVRFELEG